MDLAGTQRKENAPGLVHRTEMGRWADCAWAGFDNPLGFAGGEDLARERPGDRAGK